MEMEEKNKKHKLGLIFKGSSILVKFSVLMIVLFLIYQIGFDEGLRKAEPEVIYRDMPDIEADMSLFWEAWRIFRENYLYQEEISDQKMLYGAIKGIMGSAKDPYTQFLEPEQAEKFEEDLEGVFGGVGIEIGIRNGQLTIIAPLKGTPAEKAGLLSGDKILKVDETFTADLDLNEIVKIIRGQKGTKVILTILRDDWDAPKEIEIIRDTIVIPTLDFEMKDDKIAYIQLYNFNQAAVFKFYKTALSLRLKRANGIVLDLRNNAGGYLEVAVRLAGFFLKEGEVVVRERSRSGQEKEFKARGPSLLADLPIVVLINEGTASASEILAGALRDNRQVKLIGEKTFGKGTVQEIKDLRDGSKVKISIAEWVLPKGEIIDKKGLIPDIEIELTEEDRKQDKDPQLEKALEIIKEL